MFDSSHRKTIGREVPAYMSANDRWLAQFAHRKSVSKKDRLADLSALRDRLHAELCTLDELIAQLETEAADDQHKLARYNLGEVLGATKLGRYLGVARNTAYKLMRTDLAGVVWTDSEGRLRVTAAAVEQWLQHQRQAA